LYDVETGTALAALGTSSVSLAFSPDGRLLAVSGVEVEIWQLGTGPPVLLNSLPNFAPYGRITFSEDGAYLIAAGWDGTVRIWGVP
jgi:WD40 repeat protein